MTFKEDYITKRSIRYKAIFNNNNVTVRFNKIFCKNCSIGIFKRVIYVLVENNSKVPNLSAVVRGNFYVSNLFVICNPYPMNT